jgi:hypothetical protein
MSRTTILARAGEQHRPEIDINRMYYECTHLFGLRSAGGIPDFDEIFDAYTAAFVELRTSVNAAEIDEELVRLKSEYGPEIFDVERGFTDDLSEHKRVYVMEFLMYNQLFFAKDNKVYNVPLVGVW